MDSQPSDVLAALAADRPPGGAAAAVTDLYRAHALGLTRMAHVMLGDRQGAEDVVHDAFCGLYLRWAKLADPGKALPYLRSCVLNGCRTEIRKSRRRPALEPTGGPADGELAGPADPEAGSAESAALAGEGRRAVLAAVTRLPHRQREVLVLRYYLGEPDEAIAELLGIAGSTVRSTLHRALARLGAELPADSLPANSRPRRLS